MFEYVMDVDFVIRAIGQRVDPCGLEQSKGLTWTRRGTVSTCTANMTTSLPGVFAAGDMVTGPATVVEAIGEGKKAALAIDRYLRGLAQPKMPAVPVRRARLETLSATAAEKMTFSRPHMAMLNKDRRRVTFQQVELGYTEQQTRDECRRCLRCDVCIRCGTCVQVCRDKMGVDALHLGYLHFDETQATDFRETAERCILCGACAANCPTGALRIEDRDGERVLSICGTELNRAPLQTCRSCGAVLAPERYLEFIARRTENVAAARGGLCVNCARKDAARQHAESEMPQAGKPFQGGPSWVFAAARKWKSSADPKTNHGKITWMNSWACTASSQTPTQIKRSQRPGGGQPE